MGRQGGMYGFGLRPQGLIAGFSFGIEYCDFVGSCDSLLLEQTIQVVYV
jgi:hypothetical protein